DFQKAKEILGSPLDKLPQLAFGKDGKPFYVSGPYDQPQQIIQTLERSVGKGNYDYLIQAGPDMDML
ncbi:MAG: DNA-binding response regulator, partial [Cyanobacteria bacterium J06576_12]